MKSHWLKLSALALCFIVAGCGGKSASDGATPTPATEEPGTAEPGTDEPGTDEPVAACSKTPRSADDDTANAATLDLAAYAKPGILLPAMLSLVDVPYVSGETPDERAAQVEPYQAPVVKGLKQLGAQKIEQLWLTNSVSAALPPSAVADALCLPNVVRIEVDANYWDVVAPPWGPDQAGALQCPLTGDQCPAHCVDFMGTPVDASSGCFTFGNRERVGCAITTPGIDDGAATCRKNIATGKSYAFFGLIPVEPNFIGWTDCDSTLPFAMCD